LPNYVLNVSGDLSSIGRQESRRPPNRGKHRLFYNESRFAAPEGAGVLEALEVVGFNRALPYLVRCRGCHLRDLILAEARLTIPIIVVLLQPSDLVRLLGRTAKVTGSRGPEHLFGKPEP
jgi:hypothetical protein